MGKSLIDASAFPSWPWAVNGAPDLYRGSNVVERCFNRLKQFRGLATRYAKRAAYLPPAGSRRLASMTP
ncbi:hypothetical protein [Actinopolymorpha pittospori]